MTTQFGGFRISKRSRYAVVGWACGMAPGLLLYIAWEPSQFFLTIPPVVGMCLALWYGEFKGKIPTADELNRPITLFPRDSSTKDL